MPVELERFAQLLHAASRSSLGLLPNWEKISEPERSDFRTVASYLLERGLYVTEIDPFAKKMLVHRAERHALLTAEPGSEPVVRTYRSPSDCRRHLYEKCDLIVMVAVEDL